MKKTVINKLLKMKKSASALIAFLMLFCATAVFGQSIPITGTVTDKNGEAIPGVNVTVKGTTIGIVTDVTGKYSINIPNRNAVLEFSFLGYITQEISAGNQTQINVRMSEDTQNLNEVVVVGFGTQKKVNLPRLKPIPPTKRNLEIILSRSWEVCNRKPKTHTD